MSHRRTRTRVVSAAACLAPLGAYTLGVTTDSPPSATASPSTSDLRTASASPSATAQTAPTSEPGLGETRPINADNWMPSVEGLPPVRSDDPTKALALTGIPAASHEGFKRVVFEISGESTPGVWRGARTDDAFERGRGLPVQVGGGTVLELIINGASMTASENHYPCGTHIRVGNLDVVSDGTFEDSTHVIIGAPTACQLQIGFLSDPVRTIIDIHN